MTRWIDLSPHGMRLKLAILPKAKALVLENGDAESEKAKSLGFARRDSGVWVRPGGFDFNPREFIRVFPEAKVRETPESEFIIRIGDSPARPEADDAQAMPVDASAGSNIVGINKHGHEVHETDGARHTIDRRGRVTRERTLAIPAPGVFLRAVDDESLQDCVDGYLLNCLESENFPVPTPDRFRQTISSHAARSQISSEKLVSRINVSIEKSISRDKMPLRDKFSRAVAFEKALRGAGQLHHIDLPLSVAVRRMMGTDIEMLGQSVALDGAGLSVLRGLLPRGARQSDSWASATITVDFADGGRESIRSRLAARNLDARSFVFMGTGKGDDRRSDLAALAESYHVEAVGEMSHTPGVSGLLAIIGSPLDAKRADFDPSSLIRAIDGYPDLWTWATDVSIARTRLAEVVESGLATETELTNADPSITRNFYQVPYASASKSTPSTMVPKELDGPTRIALDRAAGLLGDVDHRVALEFGIPEDALHDLLAAEQIDALAVYLAAEHRDRNAILIADGPGVGKGRTLVAIAKRGVMQGKRVLFLTEREINLSDFQRDVGHIKADNVILPYVLNDGVSLIDEATGDKFEVGDQAIIRKSIEKGIWPEGVDIIYATYSQFNRSTEDSARSEWLNKVISDDVLIIADECHNAAGNSNISKNIEVAVGNCGFTVFSSGTYSSTPSMMRLYKNLFPESLSNEEIVSMMNRGGEEFQEVIAAMLVADGVMVRRELDLSQIEFTSLLDSANLDRNRDLMDRLALIISGMADLSGELDAWIEGANRENARTGAKPLQINRVSFGSPLYTMTRLFSAALLSSYAAERAIEALNKGEKPVILVENTVQAILEEAAAKGGDQPDFKAVVHRILDQITAPVGETSLLVGEVRHAVENIRGLIDGLPPLPASAIDDVRSRIEVAGYSCGEITGRSLEIRDGKVVPRSERNRTRIKNDFNAGRLDALIMNVAGSTGVDMHASRRFKDKRRRVLIELQGPSHVSRQIQSYFRVFRRDQETQPRIEMLSTGLPAEARLGAMRNHKLRRLSANVSSNRDNAFLSKDIPDLINSVGDSVIAKYAEMRPDLIERLHLSDRSENTDENVEQGNAEQQSASIFEHSANRFLSRLMLLPTAAQERILSDLTSEYEAQIAELEAHGKNPLRPGAMDGIVHVRDTRIFEHGYNAREDSVFDGPLHLMNVVVERVADPISADAVVEAVERGAGTYSKVMTGVSSLKLNREQYIEPYLPKTVRTVAEGIARCSPRVVFADKTISMLIDVLPQLVPGRVLDIPFSESEGKPLITSVSVPKPGYEHMPSLYWVGLAVPGSTAITQYNLHSLLDTDGFVTTHDDGRRTVAVGEGLEGNEYDHILDEFDNATARKMTPAVLLTSNIFRAVRLVAEHKIGRLVSFVDSNGVRNRGVLVNKSAEKALNMISLRIDSIDGAMHVARDLRGELTTAPGSSTRAIIITPLSSDQWTIRIPLWSRKRSGEIQWPSSGLKELYDSGVKDSKLRSRLTVESVEDLQGIFETLSDAGIKSFFASSKYRTMMGPDACSPETNGPRK